MNYKKNNKEQVNIYNKTYYEKKKALKSVEKSDNESDCIPFDNILNANEVVDLDSDSLLHKRLSENSSSLQKIISLLDDIAIVNINDNHVHFFQYLIAKNVDYLSNSLLTSKQICFADSVIKPWPSNLENIQILYWSCNNKVHHILTYYNRTSLFIFTFCPSHDFNYISVLKKLYPFYFDQNKQPNIINAPFTTGDSCGLLSLGYAILLLFKINPTKVIFNVKDIQNCIINNFESKNIYLFKFNFNNQEIGNNFVHDYDKSLLSPGNKLNDKHILIFLN